MMTTQRALRELNTSPRAMRSPSISSDVHSTRSTAGPTVPEANPLPTFVAKAEASQLVSSEVDDNVNVKDQALLLLNSFLDHILYTILSTAKSVQLARLRDAVPLVLKPRLGKAALGAADEELKEYLNEGDDDILAASDSRSEPRGDFDLDLAWKLARLRCMVYTRLGDMEEEDEEEYIESEQLHPGSGTYTNAAHRASTVKAASAIFLTSILEYLGEQVLLYAVQNTQRRGQAPKSPVALQLNDNGPMSPPIHQSMVLDESDMFYVGRESPLSRLWRSWRRQTRSPITTTSRQISPIRDDRQLTSEKTPRIEETSQEEIQDSGSPHLVPLPISNNDVNEIEVPGLAREIVDDGDTLPPIPVPERSKKRPLSMIINTTDAAYQPSPDFPQTTMVKQRRQSRPNLGHMRTMSHPTPEKQMYSHVLRTDAQDVESPNVAEDADSGNSKHPTVETTPENAPHDSLEPASEEEQPKKGHSEAGIVATAVSAAAAALGIGALASSSKANGAKSTEPQTKPLRTVADEMVGTTPQVELPNDAVTGSSTTSAGDFGNTHVPVESPKVSEEPEHVSGLDPSDPEDLALSSDDEDAPQIPSEKPVNDSTYLRNGEQVVPPRPTSALQLTEAEEPSSNAPNISPKALNRQGMVFAASQEAAKEHAPATDQQEPDRPLWAAPVDRAISTRPISNHQVVTMPATSSSSSTVTAINKNAVSEGLAQPEEEPIRESVASRPNTATTTIQSSVPPRVSSDRSRLGHAHTDSRTSQNSQESKRSSSSSKLLGFTRDQDGRPQTATSQGPVMQSIHAYNTSSPASGREIQSELAKEPLKVETNAARDKEVREAEAKKRSLEILIRGDETLHYTLTPISARAENFPLPGHSPTTSRNLSSRDGSNAAHHSIASGTSNSVNGLRANPVNDVVSSSSLGPGNSAYESPVGNTASLSSNQAKPRTNRAQPRDARLDNTTMMDLADYARSTGPENEQQLPKALSSRPGTAATVKTVRSTTNTVRTMPAPPMPHNRPTTQQSQGSKSVGARARFQPREATVERRFGTNDLIDFLKEGPPSSAGGVNGNVSNENGRASAASTQNSSVAPRSIQESTDSSTALLASNRAQAQRANGIKSTSAAAAAAAARVPPRRDAMPARKQKRVRDPYAIDDSDDDIEEEQTPAQDKRTQDESLIDFLRNTAPPPGSSPQAILSGSLAGSSSAAATAAATKQSSAQGIRERIMRSASRSSLNRKGSVNDHQPAITNNERPPYYQNTGRARESSPHLSQTGKKIDTYKPTTITHAPHVDRNRTQLKARAPTSTTRTDTADLADYLKNSGPPDVPAASMRQSSIVKDDTGFLKFFSRRRAMKS